jgi:hypothetical protein
MTKFVRHENSEPEISEGERRSSSNPRAIVQLILFELSLKLPIVFHRFEWAFDTEELSPCNIVNARVV